MLAHDTTANIGQLTYTRHPLRPRHPSPPKTSLPTGSTALPTVPAGFIGISASAIRERDQFDHN
jgi:hypothetical protein